MVWFGWVVLVYICSFSMICYWCVILFLKVEEYEGLRGFLIWSFNYVFDIFWL